MSRPRTRSGPHEIADAERLFLKSVDSGAPDFRFVVLAIGAKPYRPPAWAISECEIELERTVRRFRTGLITEDEILPPVEGETDFRYLALTIGADPKDPPKWAVWQCILERDRTARRAAIGSTEVDDILDQLIRRLATEQFRKADNPTLGDACGTQEAMDGDIPKLATAIRAACEELGLRSDFVFAPSKAETDWMKDVVRAWDREQEEGPVNSSHRLFKWHTTKRINDIMEGMLGEEFGFAGDMERLLWEEEATRELDA